MKNAVFWDVTPCSLVELRTPMPLQRNLQPRSFKDIWRKTATLVLIVEGFFRNVGKFLQALFAV
jgi:hypothetical protein